MKLYQLRTKDVISISKEMEMALREAGYTLFASYCSESFFGLSHYIVTGDKNDVLHRIRISDHGVTNFEIEELQVHSIEDVIFEIKKIESFFCTGKAGKR